MKCDDCAHRLFHSAGSWYSVAEGGDDPYDYEYCAKHHWVGDSTEPQKEEDVGVEDPYINCPDYKQEALGLIRENQTVQEFIDELIKKTGFDPSDKENQRLFENRKRNH